MSFPEALKLHIRRRAHFACCLCHAIGSIEVHHIIPQEDGGRDTVDNAAPLCPSCHETYGANPKKRKFIREARDFWYEICEQRFSSDPERLDEIGTMLQNAATKDDLEKAAGKIISLLQDTKNEQGRSVAQRTQEVAQVGGMIAAGVGANRHCKNCGTTIGLFIGDQGKCPNCGTPW